MASRYSSTQRSMTAAVFSTLLELADDLADRVERDVDGLVGVPVGRRDRHARHHVLQRHAERLGVAGRLPGLGPVVLQHAARLAGERAAAHGVAADVAST